jgi:hypothetical protein
LHINVAATSAKPITAVPTTLVNNTYLTAADATVSRSLTITGGQPAGNPFVFDNKKFEFNTINKTLDVNTTEKWTVTNTNIFSHAFHIHDVEFKILSRSTGAVGQYESGWKDVFYIAINETVTFVARFADYADPIHPFMYHCHFGNHEDGGMMGQFVVKGTTSTSDIANPLAYEVYPNPADDRLYVQLADENAEVYYVTIFNTNGKAVMMLPQPQIKQGFDISALPPGAYAIQIMEKETKAVSTKKFVKL